MTTHSAHRRRRRRRHAATVTLWAVVAVSATSLADVARASPGESTIPPPADPVPPPNEPVPTTTDPAAATTSSVPTTTDPGGGAAPAPLGQYVSPDDLAPILATIRYMESRGIYTLPPNKGGASGAYQYIRSTWANFRDFRHAYLAPPAVQDERAALDVTQFLAQWNNDVSMIPVMWYYPAAATRPALMDVVPVPSAGNVLTIREYQQRWLGVFSTISGQPVVALTPEVPAAPVLGVPPTVPERVDGRPSLSFPALGPAELAVPDCDEAIASDAAARSGIEAAGLCTDAAPAIVFGSKLQPVLAVADGVVTEVVDEPGAGTPISVTVTDEGGRSYVYSGFNDDQPGTDNGFAPPHLRLAGTARLGDTVRAGQVLGFMGDTDPLPAGVTRPGEGATAHIRVSMFELDGRAIDSYGPVIDALFRQTCVIAAGPWSLPENGIDHEEVTVEVGDPLPDVDSEWVITSTGQMTASGWAAMINPQESCESVPTEAYGPGAEGPTTTPAAWLAPMDLPTTTWVKLAVQSAEIGPDNFVSRI